MYVCNSFATPPIKLKVRQQQIGVGTTNSKPPGPIIMIMDQPIRNTQEQQLDPIYYTLFCRVHRDAVPLPATANVRNYAEPKPIS